MQKLIFIHGKGGVGKSYLSLGLAQALSAQGRSVLLATLNEPTLPPEHHERDGISAFNCIPTAAFEEYIERTLKIPAIARILAKNTLIQLLSKVAPGIKEIVSLGKIWSLRDEYDHVVIDLPSSGYGLSLFHSVKNFMRLFGKGRSFEDSRAMLETFNDPSQVRHFIVALAEEMPLTEAEEVSTHLRQEFPDAPQELILNRLMPVNAKHLEETFTEGTGEAFIVDRARAERDAINRHPAVSQSLRFNAMVAGPDLWKGLIS